MNLIVYLLTEHSAERMRNTNFLTLILITALLSGTLFHSCINKPQQSEDQVVTNTNTMSMQKITEANNALYAGLNEMFAGNIEPLNKLWMHNDSITYMGPFGGCLVGWPAVSKEFSQVAAMKLGGSIVCSNANVYAGTDMGYVSCVEEGENIGPDGKPVRVSHRATNIFQLADGKWRLVHHHTDISSQLEETYDKEIK